MSSPVKDLYEFLLSAELQQYYNGFRADLKVRASWGSGAPNAHTDKDSPARNGCGVPSNLYVKPDPVDGA